MTEAKAFKRRIRERMSKTGESYTAARTQVAAKRDRNNAARARLSARDDRPSEESVTSATGKTWDEWFAILDRWGAQKKKHPEMTRYLTDKHQLPGWWTQSIAVYYQRARGMRLKHQNASGFQISGSKTVSVPVSEAFEAVVDDVKRKKWFPDASLSLRTAQPNRSARFDWEDGTTRVNVGFEAKGPSKTTVSLVHERLRDADEAESTKAMWKERLADLKAHLEA